MGYDVPLKQNNRFSSFNALRTQWKSHIKASMLRPVLLIDEAHDRLTPSAETPYGRPLSSYRIQLAHQTRTVCNMDLKFKVFTPIVKCVSITICF